MYYSSHERLPAAPAIRGGASYSLAAGAAGVTKPAVVGCNERPAFLLDGRVDARPGRAALPHQVSDDRGGGWVSVLLVTPYRLAAEALGRIIVRVRIGYAGDDKVAVSMPNPAVLRLAGIAPQCVISLHTDIGGVLDRPRSLRA